MVVGEFAGGVEGGAGVEGAVIIKAVEDGAVVAHVVFVAFVEDFGGKHVGWCYSGVYLVSKSKLVQIRKTDLCKNSM